MKRLLSSKIAVNDLQGILDFIAKDDPVAARSFIDAVIATCHRLAQHPEMGMLREDVAPTLRVFWHQGYGVYYHNLDSELMIERVLHPSLDIRRQSFGDT
jgi:toxin ParE1/3/4